MLKEQVVRLSKIEAAARSELGVMQTKSAAG